MADEILVRHEGEVVVITFNRPAVHNAANAAMAQALADTLDRFDKREDAGITERPARKPLAAAMTRTAPLAMTTSKRIVDESPDWPIGWMFNRRQGTALALMNSADAREGAAALRPPRRQPKGVFKALSFQPCIDGLDAYRIDGRRRHMKRINRRLCLTLAAALGYTLGLPGLVQAQDFPTRPITIVVPYAAGGATDVTARRFAEGLGRRLSTTVIVDNKPGAATAIGAAYVARAPKDGYTLLFAPGTTTSVNPHLYTKLSYQLSDFTPVSMVSRQTFVLSVGAGHPAKSFRELLAYGKSRPDGLTYGTTGTGSMTNIIGEWVGKTTGLKLVEVPYKGTAPATIDVISGRIDMQFEGITSTVSMASSGKERPLVIMADKPSPMLPGVPTFRDEGYPDLVAFTNFGLLAPKGTPGPVIDKLHAATVATVASPEFIDSLAASGETAVSSPSPRQFASFLNEEFEHWGRIIKPMKIQLD